MVSELPSVERLLKLHTIAGPPFPLSVVGGGTTGTSHRDLLPYVLSPLTLILILFNFPNHCVIIFENFLPRERGTGGKLLQLLKKSSSALP